MDSRCLEGQREAMERVDKVKLEEDGRVESRGQRNFLYRSAGTSGTVPCVPFTHYSPEIVGKHLNVCFELRQQSLSLEPILEVPGALLFSCMGEISRYYE